MKELQLLAVTGLDTTVWVERTVMKDGKGQYYPRSPDCPLVPPVSGVCSLPHLTRFLPQPMVLQRGPVAADHRH